MKLTVCAQGKAQLCMRPLPRYPDNHSECKVEVPIPHRSQHFSIIQDRCVSPLINVVLFSSLTLTLYSHCIPRH